MSEVEKEEIVKFHADEEIRHETKIESYQLPIELKKNIVDQHVHDIVSFLRRPVMCWSGNFTTSHVVGTPITTMAFPSTCIAQSSYKEKLRGFYAFRAKMVVRLQVNAQRFQQGRLLMHYMPETFEATPERIFTALSSLGLITQQPRLDLDIAVDTEAVMEIPFVSNYAYASLIDDTYDYGTFYVTPYTQLKVGTGTTSVKLAVWCHFEDVEIMYPTVPGLTTQSGIKIKRGRGGASVGKVDTTDQELNLAQMGPISGLAARVSNATRILSEVPLISAFTAPVSWVADVVSRSALAMGYSKPTAEGPYSRGVPTLFPNMRNYDAVDNSQKMAVSIRNKLEMLPGFASTDVDELSFTHLKSIPSCINVVNWTSAQASGTQLAYYQIGPSYLYYAMTYNGTTITTVAQARPPFGYLSNMFAYWRGGVKFIFKVAKTEFHSGRLLVAFMPGQDRAQADLTFAQTQYVYREVFDLRTSSEFTIEIPYVGLKAYMRQNQWTGVLKLFVLNQLNAPDTVASNVDIVVECCASDDFEVAMPLTWASDGDKPLIPFLVSQTGLSLKGLSSQGMAPRLQRKGGVLDEVDSQPIDSEAINSDLVPAKYCIGEYVDSVRQLLKMFSCVYAGNPGAVNRAICVPAATNLMVQKTGVNAPAVPTCDIYSYFAQLYRYYRGGMRFKVIPTNANNVITTARIAAVSGSYAAPVTFDTNGTAELTGTSSLDLPVTYNSVVGTSPEIEIPYYGETHARFVYNAYAGYTVNQSLARGGPTLVVSCSSNFTTPRIYRAVSDDFSMGFFIGTLPLLYATV